MIKKKTKIIFEGVYGTSNEFEGGVSLCIGEVVTVTLEGEEKQEYEVVDKKVYFNFREDESLVDMVYVLRKK